jgi:hypothetical protein
LTPFTCISWKFWSQPFLLRTLMVGPHDTYNTSEWGNVVQLEGEKSKRLVMCRGDK